MPRFQIPRTYCCLFIVSSCRAVSHNGSQWSQISFPASAIFVKVREPGNGKAPPVSMPRTHKSEQERSNIFISKSTENPQFECKWAVRARRLPMAQAQVGRTPANLDRPEETLYHQSLLHSTASDPCVPQIFTYYFISH